MRCTEPDDLEKRSRDWVGGRQFLDVVLVARLDGWAAAGFTDTEFGCDDETGGEPWEREGYSAASTSLRL